MTSFLKNRIRIESARVRGSNKDGRDVFNWLHLITFLNFKAMFSIVNHFDLKQTELTIELNTDYSSILHHF